MMRSLLESAAGQYGFRTGVSEAAIRKYSAEYGAQQIAMETLADQQAVFECAFYDMEVMEFHMITGDCLVLEGFADKAKSIFSKIRTKIKELWEKVKSWLHNVRRYLDGIFMDGEAFVKKYKSELTNLKLEEFTYELYTYTPDTVEQLLKKTTEESVAIKNADNRMEEIKKSAMTHTQAARDEIMKVPASELDSIEFDDDAKRIILNDIDNNISSMDELREFVWSGARNGLAYGHQKSPVRITKLDSYIKEIESSKSKLETISKLQSTIDRSFNDLLKRIKDIEKYLESGRVVKDANQVTPGKVITLVDKKLTSAKRTENEYIPRAIKYVRFLYASTAFTQSILITVCDELKKMYAERTKDYKGMFMKALSNRRRK